ncbi:MAG: glutathione S-transferase family protein [Proteobacteria bacterium]|nr:glutathione S-transferase family protein [Pseudomonadota bacterium]
MEILLYYAPNTCAIAPYISLTEANATFEARPLNYRKQEQRSAEYVTLNPKHKVPLLVVDGVTLTESTAIQTWIARTFPEAKLMPTDPWEELKAISLHSWCSSGIHPYLSRINNPARVCDVPDAEESVIRLASKNLTECFGIADEMLSGREYFFDHFMSPDAHFFWCCRRATQLGFDLSEFTNCMAHFERMTDRPSTQKLLAYENEVKAAFAEAAE